MNRRGLNWNVDTKHQPGASTELDAAGVERKNHDQGILVVFCRGRVDAGGHRPLTRRRRRRGEPGRLKIRLAELLQAEGFDISEYGIHDPQGYWRSADCYRWEAIGKHPDFGKLDVEVFSWETMTLCVRYGIEIWHEDGDLGNNFMCGPKDPNSQTQSQQGSGPSVQH